jgi:ribosome biogenesis GTPase
MPSSITAWTWFVSRAFARPEDRFPYRPQPEESNVYDLEQLGFSPFFEHQIRDDERALTPARVSEEQRGSFRLLGAAGSWYAELAGRLRHEAAGGGAVLPGVGDWVMAQVPAAGTEGVALVHRVLERRTCFSRKAPGEQSVEQVIAANVDTVFLVQSLNRNFNPRRVERYLALLWESGAEPVVVLSKSDLCADPAAAVAEVEQVAAGVAVLVTTALDEHGLEALEPYLGVGKTVALVGSSGVGKSTIVNRLAGHEVMAVQGSARTIAGSIPPRRVT